MDDGRRWAIETFGADGAHIRSRIPEMVRAEQEASADAQEASGHRSRSVFGQFSTGMLERFQEFAQLPGGTLVRPGQAPYKIAVINGVALYPWRFGDGRQGEANQVPFATSDARTALFDLGPVPTQAELDLGLSRPGLSAEDATLVALLRDEQGSEAERPRKVVVVAIACSMAGVQDARWGEASLTTDGYLDWQEVESLMHLSPTAPALVMDSTRTFQAGEPPKKALRLHADADADADTSTANGDE